MFDGVNPVELEPQEIHHDHFTRFRQTLGAMDPQLKIILDEIQKLKDDFIRRFNANKEQCHVGSKILTTPTPTALPPSTSASMSSNQPGPTSPLTSASGFSNLEALRGG